MKPVRACERRPVAGSGNAREPGMERPTGNVIQRHILQRNPRFLLSGGLRHTANRAADYGATRNSEDSPYSLPVVQSALKKTGLRI